MSSRTVQPTILLTLQLFERKVLGFLAMRRGSECMASLRSELECCGVSGNLISSQTLRSSSSRNSTDPVIPERN
ncbi:hypothetical protein CY34DRAFT_814139 [Suillus luteus UH-Slu-Lm8-n1]|uniref:Uncharacterized protein n=1 Tax=Suillus luteus UH-Slu-Lm8-n1 TaxID=930992 RepID=A0A0C9Z5G4_9AGAM|nr:hypothetical protein CY34DRAFT_814139 [Suillus luteus UH-Slu-Lm8-n1]